MPVSVVASNILNRFSRCRWCSRTGNIDHPTSNANHTLVSIPLCHLHESCAVTVVTNQVVAGVEILFIRAIGMIDAAQIALCIVAVVDTVARFINRHFGLTLHHLCRCNSRCMLPCTFLNTRDAGVTTSALTPRLVPANRFTSLVVNHLAFVKKFVPANVVRIGVDHVLHLACSIANTLKNIGVLVHYGAITALIIW